MEFNEYCIMFFLLLITFICNFIAKDTKVLIKYLIPLIVNTFLPLVLILGLTTDTDVYKVSIIYISLNYLINFLAIFIRYRCKNQFLGFTHYTPIENLDILIKKFDVVRFTMYLLAFIISIKFNIYKGDLTEILNNVFTTMIIFDVITDLFLKNIVYPFLKEKCEDKK
ncbi:hypothetical protein K4R79_07525 [Staphylococcus epidermidis]|nr:hypothetical protein [Staphylococcus epidermidis]MCG1808057.1 hypothetical protein [Staphylococcus epidermidis]MCG2229359.1 hypothetical protein [Staphylococcus epidermidis]MCG2414264.1 hypothetical protein [Staphylococcus epidermidis]